MQTWRLHTAAQTLAFASEGGIPHVIYWGMPLPADEDLQSLALAVKPDVTGGMLDRIPEITLCPQQSDSFQGQPGLRIKGSAPQFRLTDAQQSYDSLTFVCTAEGFRLTFEFLIRGDVFVMSTRLTATESMVLDWLAAPVMPVPARSNGLQEFSGRWCGEMQMDINAWTPGARLRESVTGRSGHETFPAAIATTPTTCSTSGEAFAFHYGWAGGHRMLGEQLPDGRRQIQFGHATDALPRKVKTYETAPLYISYSANGLNGIARQFQEFARQEVLDFAKPDAPRPVHYNCWEAIYFDHDIPTLKEIATSAANLGAERFVLDDGWFGRRDDDTSSLGDWQIDPRKYPDGLAPLVDHITGLGMSFGIWFEPEMVNPNSDLYRNHPDWALGAADQTLGRHQLVLDMSRAEVRDYLFDKIDAVLAAYPVDYIKWDHNRVLPIVDARQTHGTYDLLARLRNAHPDVEIESCASGGGRLDYGILRHTSRVWLSDSNDALERFKMQNNAALFLPSEITGSHIGPRHCHTSGRILPMEFRAYVAASRHMGFEMDPRELTQEEAAVLMDVTDWYKANRAWMHQGHVLRLDCDDPAQLGEIQVAQDGTCFAAFLAQMTPSAQIIPAPYRLTGLDPDARYKIHLRNPNSSAAVSRGPVALRDGDLVLSGRVLMQQGVTLPHAFPATIWLLEGSRVP